MTAKKYIFHVILAALYSFGFTSKQVFYGDASIHITSLNGNIDILVGDNSFTISSHMISQNFDYNDVDSITTKTAGSTGIEKLYIYVNLHTKQEAFQVTLEK